MHPGYTGYMGAEFKPISAWNLRTSRDTTHDLHIGVPCWSRPAPGISAPAILQFRARSAGGRQQRRHEFVIQYERESILPVLLCDLTTADGLEGGGL